MFGTDGSYIHPVGARDEQVFGGGRLAGREGVNPSTFTSPPSTLQAITLLPSLWGLNYAISTAGELHHGGARSILNSLGRARRLYRSSCNQFGNVPNDFETNACASMRVV